MNFTTTQRGSVTVIGLSGNLMGGPDATALNSTLHELVGKGNTRVVLDLRGVQFMNSSGLGILIGGASTLKTAGGGLAIAGASEKILALITITRLEKVLATYPTVDAAVASFPQ
ncbi:MAG TPA: STAS domain-containing protein [Bacteroidota bacterium]|nr:STAS domain-containing protein [Bacteroidota bacterium]